MLRCNIMTDEIPLAARGWQALNRDNAELDQDEYLVEQFAAVKDDHSAEPIRRAKIALVGNYAPRKCGIATFTTDIAEKLAQFEPGVTVEVYALDDRQEPLAYAGVQGTIDRECLRDFAEAADRINASSYDAVWLQHEYGIFGGPDGELVLDFVDRIAAPLILTPHTVLTNPSDNQQRILERLVARASRIMVMSAHSRDLLAERYNAPHEILEVVPHGAPDRPFGRTAVFKRKLGLADRRIMMTFGLLSPGKGIERVIDALPAIVDDFPDVLYRIVGATHPNLLASEGETYRRQLQHRAEALGVSDNIAWDNRFLGTEQLLDQLEACDIYLTPYFDLQQSTSGTLSYAVATGKAVVATPYLHARELLAEGVGMLVAPNDACAIAEAVIDLLDNPDDLAAMQLRAYRKGRETIWPRFAKGASRVIARAIAEPIVTAPVERAPNLAGVFGMSDAVGILQHGIGSVPDRRHGYCLDDNARALILMNSPCPSNSSQCARSALAYASFVQHAWNEDAGRFRNFMNYDRTWCENQGSEDSNGRALWALGQTAANATDLSLRSWGELWFRTALPYLARFESPRALAFCMLGTTAYLKADPNHEASLNFIEHGSARLAFLLEHSRRPDWVWFERSLAYDNPRLSQALIESGAWLRNPALTQAGLTTLRWICERQLSSTGSFRPIGSEGFGLPFDSLPFDQQPLEAQAVIEAARSAYSATGERYWLVIARAAWRWFFGANDRGVVLADLNSGLCRDGINPRGANENCGAESILAFHLSHRAMLALERAQKRDSGEGHVDARQTGQPAANI